jgi:hypothetical protein
MRKAYIQAAMEQAQYEIIKDENPCYGEVPACPVPSINGITPQFYHD